MKIGDQVIEGDLAELNEDVLVLPRRKTQIVLTARALEDMTTLEKRVPQPKPNKIFHKGKGWIPDENDATYKDQMEKYATLRVAYFVVMSLEPSNITWSSVDLDNPSTWIKWEDDFKDAGFTQYECNLILGLCFRVNQLDEIKLENARQLFIHGQEEELKNSSSQNSEQSILPSGKPVSTGSE